MSKKTHIHLLLPVLGQYQITPCVKGEADSTGMLEMRPFTLFVHAASSYTLLSVYTVFLLESLIVAWNRARFTATSGVLPDSNLKPHLLFSTPSLVHAGTYLGWHNLYFEYLLVSYYGYVAVSLCGTTLDTRIVTQCYSAWRYYVCAFTFCHTIILSAVFRI